MKPISKLSSEVLKKHALLSIANSLEDEKHDDLVEQILRYENGEIKPMRGRRDWINELVAVGCMVCGKYENQADKLYLNEDEGTVACRPCWEAYNEFEEEQ